MTSSTTSAARDDDHDDNESDYDSCDDDIIAPQWSPLSSIASSQDSEDEVCIEAENLSEVDLEDDLENPLDALLVTSTQQYMHNTYTRTHT